MAGNGHGHIVALPGVLSVAVGSGVTTDMARNRAAAERVARDLKLLSDPTRVLILTELDRTPGTVGEIARRVGVAQPTASVHVRQLREAGLLTATRDGTSSSYRVERSRLREALRSAHDALLPELDPPGVAHHSLSMLPGNSAIRAPAKLPAPRCAFAEKNEASVTLSHWSLGKGSSGVPPTSTAPGITVQPADS